MNQKQDMIDTEETMLPEPDAALLPYMEKLYPLTFALKQHKPWKTIYEYEAFAVRLPDGTPACCLLTGMEGDLSRCLSIPAKRAGTTSTSSGKHRTDWTKHRKITRN